MKKFTTLETNDDVKKAVKQAAHMLDLADAEKVVLDTHEASASDLTKQYRAALDACMQAKRSGEGWEEKGAELKKAEDAVPWIRLNTPGNIWVTITNNNIPMLSNKATIIATRLASFLPPMEASNGATDAPIFIPNIK